MNILARAPSPPYVQVAEGTFTQANSRLSLVDGTAFFDCGADLSAYAGLDSGSHEYLIKVYDDDGNSIQGYVGAVGGGEAFGGDQITNGQDWTGASGVTPPTGWDAHIQGAYSIIDDGGSHAVALKCERAGGVSYPAISQDISLTSGRLYKLSGDVKFVDDNDVQIRIGVSTGNKDYLNIKDSSGVWVEKSGYFIPDRSIVYITLLANVDDSDGQYSLFDNMGLKPLTDCAATGFHIISAQGGSTQNWQNVHGSFNYNDAAYSYKIYKVR